SIMRPSIIFGVALALSSGCSAGAEEIWGWNDRQGVLHYTNDLESVPDEHRHTVETVARWRAPRAMPREEEARPGESARRAEGSLGAKTPAEEVREAFDPSYAEAREVRPAPAAASLPVADVAITRPRDLPEVTNPPSVLPSARPGLSGPLHRQMRREFLRGPPPRPLLRPLRDGFIRGGELASPALEGAAR
ncbi:MAG: DUF4124 domain-containing protein, partial [Candidatus Binatia bacterium]